MVAVAPIDYLDWYARTLDGEAAARRVRARLRRRATDLRRRGNPPALVTVLVGAEGDGAPLTAWDRECADIGIESVRCELPPTADPRDIEAAIEDFNADPACSGLVLRRPPRDDGDGRRVREAIAPEKDAEGLHPVNLGRLALLRPAPRPAVARGCVELLAHYGLTMSGANVAVVGRQARSHGVASLSLTGRAEGATVTICHCGTKNLADVLRNADIVISVAGVPRVITADMVKPWSVVLDVGARVDRAVGEGDVDRRVREVAGWLAPAGGGVAPMARAMLFANVIEAAERHAPEASLSAGPAR